MDETHGTGIWQRTIRFGLTCLLAHALARGAAWARWVSVVLYTIAGIMSVVMGIAGLRESSWSGMTLLLGVVYLVCCVMLVVPESVRAFFASASTAEQTR